jgi:hypothetical protein
MKIDLVLPSSLGGFAIGTNINSYDTSGFLVGDHDPDTWDLERFDPHLRLTMFESTIVNIFSQDECWFDGDDLKGMTAVQVVRLLGVAVVEKSGEVGEFWELEGGIQLLCFDGKVSSVGVHNFDLIPE